MSAVAKWSLKTTCVGLGVCNERVTFFVRSLDVASLIGIGHGGRPGDCAPVHSTRRCLDHSLNIVTKTTTNSIFSLRKIVTCDLMAAFSMHRFELSLLVFGDVSFLSGP